MLNYKIVFLCNRPQQIYCFLFNAKRSTTNDIIFEPAYISNILTLILITRYCYRLFPLAARKGSIIKQLLH